jgi:ankyrin repeat protein
VLEYLVTKGADFNAKDKHGISVILAAIWEGHANCVKFLLEKVRKNTIF